MLGRGRELCDTGDDAAAAMISKIVQGKDGSLRVELHDKLAAIEKVARLLGLLKEHHEVQVEDITPRPRDPGREVMRAALKRVREAALQHDIMMEAEAAALPSTGRNGKGSAEH